MATAFAPKKIRVARSEGQRLQWWFRKIAGKLNGWLKKNVTYNRADKVYRKPVAATPPWEPSGSTGGQATGPILANLQDAKVQVAINSAPTDTLANTAIDAAITKLNALKGEEVAPVIAKCNSAKANIALLTPAGDTAAQADLDAAIALVNKF